MNWTALAKALIPVVSIFVPGAPAITPLILAGIDEADAIHSATDGAAKKAHVLQLVADGAATATATGKVKIDPQNAVNVTNAVFAAVDGVKAAVQANQPVPSAPAA